MLNKKIVKLVLLVISLNLIACASTKAKLSPDFSPDKLKSLAVLPTDYPAEIRREKVDTIVSAVKNELVNKNFVVLADKLVNEVCSTPACPERKKLADKYQVDGFVTISVSAVSRTNFLAGFYNRIKGKLILSDINSNQLLEAEQLQSERGGLLFNTGQIIQGIISYADNSEAESFTKLTSGFAHGLVAKIPASRSPAVNADALAVSISEVKVTQVRPEVYQVCADATPDSLVSVVVNRQNTTLRPVKEGSYCGTFLYNQSPADGKSVIYVDARSPFGNSIRKEVQIDNQNALCDLNNNVIVSEKDGKPVIQIGCFASNASGECVDKSNQCMGNKFIVFKADSELGPYQKVAEIKSTSWTDRSAKKGSSAVYELVSVNKAGVWSLPVPAKSVIKEG